jgi:hypothetical protein
MATAHRANAPRMKQDRRVLKDLLSFEHSPIELLRLASGLR